LQPHLQTGCFWILRKNLFDLHKWDSSIGFYAQKENKITEDVEYSLRLSRLGYILSFDKNNTVWHNDNSYCQINNLCLKKDLVTKQLGITYYDCNNQRFDDLLKEYPIEEQLEFNEFTMDDKSRSNSLLAMRYRDLAIVEKNSNFNFRIIIICKRTLFDIFIKHR
jgi:hypothetical protein